jgi:hypothetical protein
LVPAGATKPQPPTRNAKGEKSGTACVATPRIPSLAWYSHTRTLISAIPLDELEIRDHRSRCPFVVRQKTVNHVRVCGDRCVGLAGSLFWSAGLEWREVRLRVVSVSLLLGASHCLLPRGGTTRRVLVS